jgi:two-component system, chemotaxis family, protein-glutamate methylesterase/glutaminase
MRTKHVVVVGASAGGIDALRELVSGFPVDFPAPVCVVVHTSPQAPGMLDSILSRSGRLSATNARDRERLEPGRIYVAPPDCHLLVEPGLVRVTRGPRENRFRPAIDPLFRSAAQVFGPAAIGVILTGNLGDGTAGLWAIKQLGGTTVVQDPADALFPAMPRNALSNVRIDHVVPLSRIPPLLVRLTSEEVPASTAARVPESVEVEVKIAKEAIPLDAGLENISEPSTFACPECHGVLMRLKEGGPIRFRCHTGHAYSIDSLAIAISEAIEEALWNTIRALEEGDMLLRTLGEHARGHGTDETAAVLTRAAEIKRQSQALRKIVMEREPIEVEP